MNHRDLAVQNFKAAPNASTEEWTITYYFYAAVHAVNDALFAPSHAPRKFSHQLRKHAMAQRPLLLSVLKTYTALELLSKTARYLPQDHPMSQELTEEARQLTIEVFKAAGIPLL